MLDKERADEYDVCHIFEVHLEIHICIFNKIQKTGFKHKYPTIEFNSENPKKRVLMNVSVYVKRHEYFKEWMTQLVIG